MSSCASINNPIHITKQRPSTMLGGEPPFPVKLCYTSSVGVDVCHDFMPNINIDLAMGSFWPS